MMTFHEFVRSQKYQDMKLAVFEQAREQKQSVNESNKVLSLSSWAMTRKKMKNTELSIDNKLASLVDLVAMGAFLNSREIAKLKTAIAKRK